uniref:Uncharacterized protein n=1 Tax=uncultured bacterium W4-21b TaxID=1130993 RepID=H9BWP3_9BACT|nr:hypothetical protein [uncultured bacterium W4-21b]
MILHLSYEIEKKEELSFDDSSELLNSTELGIIKSQIRKNACVIDEYIEKIHLFVNKEKYPLHEAFIEKLRQQMFLHMEENDTFRRVLWNHYKAERSFLPRSLLL